MLHFTAQGIGLLCCAMAKAYGAAKIVVVDINESRLEFVKRYAATTIFNAKKQSTSNFEETARLLLRHAEMPFDGADIVVDASGVPSSIHTGILSVRPGGTFVQGGMGNSNLEFPIAALCAKELSVKGSFRYGPGDYATAIRLVADGKVDVKALITKRVEFERAVEAFEEMALGRGIKAIIAGPSFSEGNGTRV